MQLAGWNPELFQIVQFFRLFHSRRNRFIDGFTRLTGTLSDAVPKGDNRVAHWLMKSEPESYGWDELVRDGGTEWDGVRNNAARLHLQSNEGRRRSVLLPQHVGQGGGRHHAHHPRSAARSQGCELGLGPGRAGSSARTPVTLAEIKAEPALAKMELIRQSRLSVAPVRDEEWDKVLEMARG